MQRWRGTITEDTKKTWISLAEYEVGAYILIYLKGKKATVKNTLAIRKEAEKR